MRDFPEPLSARRRFSNRESPMPDQPAAPSLTLDLECTNEVIIVHCHGQLVSELSDIFSPRSPHHSRQQTDRARSRQRHPHGQHGPRHSGRPLHLSPCRRVRDATPPRWQADSRAPRPHQPFICVHHHWRTRRRALRISPGLSRASQPYLVFVISGPSISCALGSGSTGILSRSNRSCSRS